MAQGLYGGAGVGGAGAALAAVPLVENPVGWRAPYLSALVLAAIVMVVLALAPEDAPRERRGIPFAPALVRAHAARPDAPAAATGFINLTAVVVILAATPLLGAAFSLPDDGRLGFAVVDLLWALSALAARKL